MSASERPALAVARAHRERRPRRRWSLHRRLLLGTVLLVAVLGVAVGAISTGVLRQTLVDRVDRSVLALVDRSGDSSTAPSDFDGDDRPPRPGVSDYVVGEGRGALGAIVVDGTVKTAGYVGVRGEANALSDAQVAAIAALPADGAVYDLRLGGDLGDYRAAAVELSDGAIVVAALPLDEVEDTVWRLAVIITAVTLLGLALAVILAGLVVRVALRPLDRVVATAGRVSELELSAGEVDLDERVPDADADGVTEVGRVGAALNRLLERVESALKAREASEQKLRRFAADAGHELRTPLAAIRGYSELLGRDDTALDEDGRRSLARIDSESKRMGAIVEDLLLLARLDAGPAIAQEHVDLALVLVDAVGDAHAAAPEHRWELELAGEEVPVIGDPQRLHQVVANLLANARVHTPAGTTVVAGVERRDGIAVLTVADDGPGIPEALHESLFERFVRGDSGRARAAGSAPGGSTGLGLAIVKALVEAHHGTVAVESTPGHTVFTIELPLADPEESAPAAPAER